MTFFALLMQIETLFDWFTFNRLCRYLGARYGCRLCVFLVRHHNIYHKNIRNTKICVCLLLLGNPQTAAPILKEKCCIFLAKVVSYFRTNFLTHRHLLAVITSGHSKLDVMLYLHCDQHRTNGSCIFLRHMIGTCSSSL